MSSFARSLGQLVKTDRIDARVLALYAERAELKVRQYPDEETGELRSLCARRDDLLEMIVAEQNRLEHTPKRPCCAKSARISVTCANGSSIWIATSTARWAALSCGAKKMTCSIACREWDRCRAPRCSLGYRNWARFKSRGDRRPGRSSAVQP